MSHHDIFCAYCHYRLPEREQADAPGAAASGDLSHHDPDPLIHEAVAQPSSRRGVHQRMIAASVIAALAVAMAAFVVVREEWSREPATPLTALPVLRAPPSARWQHSIGGSALAIASDGSSVFVATADRGLFVLQAFAIDSGHLRWSSEFDLSGRYDLSDGSRGVASLAVIDDEVAMMFDPGGQLAMIDAATGETTWTYVSASTLLSMDAAGVLRGFRSSDGSMSVQRIEPDAQRVSEPIEDVYLVDDAGRIYLDRDHVVTIDRDDPADGEFRFEHTRPMQGLFPLEDGTFVAVVTDPPRTFLAEDGSAGVIEQLSPLLLGLDANGTPTRQFDPGVGGITGVEQLTDGRLLVHGAGSSGSIRVIAWSEPTPRVLTEVRSYQSVTVGPGPDGADVVFGTQGASSEGETTVSILDESGGRFHKIADVTGYSAPIIHANGPIAYLTSNGNNDPPFGSGPVTGMVAAVDARTGATLWNIGRPPSLMTWTTTGFATVTTTEPAGITVYSK